MPDWLAVLGGATAALLALIALWKATSGPRDRIRGAVRQTSRAIEVMAGTPEVRDPDRPGEILRPAQPDIGTRLTRLEDLQHQYITGAAETAVRVATEAAEKVAELAEVVAGLATREEVANLAETVQDLSKGMNTWQTRDVVRAETANAVLHEIGMTMPAPQREDGS